MSTVEELAAWQTTMRRWRIAGFSGVLRLGLGERPRVRFAGVGRTVWSVRT